MQHDTFDAHADKYDSWYDSKAKKPYLEMGVGSGRFAQALGIEYGVDPSIVLLRMAESRGILSLKATGEKLPFADDMFGGVLVALTLYFVDDPVKMLQEASRVLQPEGGFVLGLILKGSPWAEFYATKGKQGHPIYSKAKFFSRREVENLLELSGFDVLEYRSVLFQSPDQSTYHPERSVAGYRESTGFVAIGSIRLL